MKNQDQQVQESKRQINKGLKTNVVTLRLDDETLALIESLKENSKAVYGMSVNKTDIIIRALSIGLPAIKAKLNQSM